MILIFSIQEHRTYFPFSHVQSTRNLQSSKENKAFMETAII